MLRLENIHHSYLIDGRPERPVLAIDSWELTAGDHVLLRGVSGSGKTTLFNVIAGLLRPTRGEVWIDGQPLYARPEAQRDRIRAQHIGYVFQSHHLLPALSALENTIMPLAFAGVPAAERRQRARDLLARLDLSAVMHHRPAQLSAGQRLRVAVARALAHRPRLVLADEPTAALDPEAAAAVMALIEAECRPQNALLIVASHDPALSPRFPLIADLRAGHLEMQLEVKERTPDAV